MTDPTSDSVHNIENYSPDDDREAIVEKLPGGWKMVERESHPTDSNEPPFKVWQFFRPDESLAISTTSEHAAAGIKMVITETADA